MRRGRGKRREAERANDERQRGQTMRCREGKRQEGWGKGGNDDDQEKGDDENNNDASITNHNQGYPTPA